MSTIDSPSDGAHPTNSTQYDHRTYHEAETDGSLSVTVVTALGEALDTDPTTVAPLYHSIDPDALDTLFTPVEEDSTAFLGFEHDGCAVEVCGDGEVLVSVLDD